MKIFRRIRAAWYALHGKLAGGKQPIFEPKFYSTNLELEGEVGRYNPEFYATEESAAEVMRRFNALAMFQKSMMDGEKLTPPQWWLRFDDGLEVCAGQMCKLYKDHPPEVAPMYCLKLMQMLREEKKGED